MIMAAPLSAGQHQARMMRMLPKGATTIAAAGTPKGGSRVDHNQTSHTLLQGGG